ncbi:hypothetical protein I4U23_016640, partial [Adineta vaga]
MSKLNTTCFHTLTVEIFYRILDHQSEINFVLAMRNVCQRFNKIIDSYDRYQ